jgi:cell division protein FtsB
MTPQWESELRRRISDLERERDEWKSSYASQRQRVTKLEAENIDLKRKQARVAFLETEVQRLKDDVRRLRNVVESESSNVQ